uniref:TerD domain-containing protein n=1 Tax=Pyrodinium bahamense TaxID=73915 RepID=A0A7S0FWW7_9DINO|mmetsp:Transcript_53788/g.149256  ORF Transcript_53788/g.149256 Transcript_53788/m.149256 type:complete len:471 (+) Transcript_53788:155-1567(+)
MKPSSLTKYAAEFIGTFFLVFTIGCNMHSGSIGGALSVGCVIMAMVYSLGTISGAHFNPAITLAVVTSGRSKMTGGQVACYILSQVLGSFLGTFTYWMVVDRTLRHWPLDYYSSSEAFTVEVIYTWALCYVFLNVTMQGRGGMPPEFLHTSNGLAIGFTVTAAFVAIGPISGCSLNPAVSFGSLCVARLVHQGSAITPCCPYTWAPFVGALIGSSTFYLVRGGQFEHLEDEWSPGAVGQGLQVPAAQSPLGARAVKMRAEDKGPPPGSFGLSKQVPVVLPEGISDHQLFCGLRWRMKQSIHDAVDTCDIDLSCVKFGRAGECLGGVYFHEKDDPDNGIHHSGDEVIGEARPVDNEVITLRLSDIGPNVHALFFTMMIYTSGKSFGDIQQCYIRLVDVHNGTKEHCRYEKDRMDPGHNALIAAMLYRMGSQWCFKAVDETFALMENPTYRHLIPQMADIVLQTAMGSVEQP